MKQPRLIIMLVTLVVVVVIAVWRAAFYVPTARRPERPAEPTTSAEPNTPGEVRKTVDAGEAKEVVKATEPGEATGPGEQKGPEAPADPNEPLESLNLKDVEMKDLIQKIAEWTGKVIIPTEDVMKQKITIYAPEPVRRSHALLLIYSALRTKGYVAEYTDGTIYFKPIEKAKLLSVPTLPADVPLAAIEDKGQVVQKFFKLTNYSPTGMADIILPLIDEYGYVSADETTGQLLVIDTIENLMRVGRIIAQFDVPEAEQTKTEVFEVDHADPAEIVQVLRILLGEGGGRSSRGSGGSSRRTPRRAREERRKPSEKDKSKSGGVATSVVRGPSGAPIILIPDRKRKWIIARASPEDMEEIRKWILELDQKERIEPEYEAVPISYADVTEVATRLNEVLQQMPGEELQTSVLVQPLVQARQIVIYGRADVRDMVKKLIVEIDVPTGQFETKVFDLHHADPEQIKENIEDLYEDINADLPWWYRRYRQTTRSAEWVKVIAFPTMQQVTVIASPENMRKIEEQIKEWDVPIDVDKVKPLIIALKNTDPVKMADLLTTLFSEESDSWRPWWWPEESKKKIVGPLYGQLTFEEVPGTKKIIVVSKIPEAYRVVKEFVKELDKQEMAEIPRVVTLKYADPEDLAERLNAMFNEPGTVATIRFSETGLSEYSMEETEGEGGSSEGSTNQGEYKPWWTAGRRRMDEMPISNVIGRIRFIPDPRTKSILVLSPPEFIDSIEDMIGELDIPGRQVRVKATILMVDHRGLTSLGLQLATNPLAFGALDENAITALTTLSLLSERGSLTITGDMSVTALIDFLVKKIDAKILNEQTLWTKDNEEADFFRGDKIAFTTQFSVSEVGGRVTSGFEFERVGMTLRVRPSITPEKNVDMTINIIISQLKPEIVNEQPVRTEMDTETTLIVQDGETIMLGGMLFQEDSTIERKIPLFGDIPLLGGLFRHNQIVKANTEMLVFVTPYVIDEDPSQMLSETIESIESEREKLKSVIAELKGATERSEN